MRGKDRQEICKPVSLAFGGEGDTDGDTADVVRCLMTNAVDNEEVAGMSRELAGGVQEERARAASNPEKSLASGGSARYAIVNLGCSACGLSEVCKVYKELKEAADQPRSALKQPRDKPSPSYSFATENDVTITELLSTPARDLVDSELKYITTSGAFQDAKLPTFLLSSKSGSSVEIVDATSIVDVGKISPAEFSRLRTLQKKFSNAVTSEGHNHQSQITNVNSAILNQLTRQPKDGGVLYEIRGGDKSRLYILVCKGSDRETSRIVIIGSHGDSQADQDRFLRQIVKDGGVKKHVHDFRL